jgi:hypothetical protein
MMLSEKSGKKGEVFLGLLPLFLFSLSRGLPQSLLDSAVNLFNDLKHRNHEVFAEVFVGAVFF